MEKIERKVVNETIVTSYKAYDGTEFDNNIQCEVYEKSAVGILFSRLVPYMLEESDEECLFNGNPENSVRTYYIESQEVADILGQLYLIVNPKRVLDTKDWIGHVIWVHFYMYNNNVEWLYITDINDFIEKHTQGKFKIVKNGKK